MRHDACVVVYGEYIYVVGGVDESGMALADVDAAHVAADGALDHWQLESFLPQDDAGASDTASRRASAGCAAF